MVHGNPVKGLRETIVTVVEAQLKETYSYLRPGDIKITIKSDLEKEIPLGVAKILPEIKPNASLLGNTVMTLVYFNKAGDKIEKKTVMIHTEAFTTFIKARSPLFKGQIIQEHDLKSEYETMLGKPYNSVRELKDIVSKEAIATIPADTVILEAWVRPVPVIKRGDVIQMIIEGENMQLKAKGKALNDGGKGDIISVQSIFKADKILRGEVVDSQNIKINLAVR